MCILSNRFSTTYMLLSRFCIAKKTWSLKNKCLKPCQDTKLSPRYSDLPNIVYGFLIFIYYYVQNIIYRLACLILDGENLIMFIITGDIYINFRQRERYQSVHIYSCLLTWTSATLFIGQG